MGAPVAVQAFAVPSVYLFKHRHAMRCDAMRCDERLRPPSCLLCPGAGLRAGACKYVQVQPQARSCCPPAPDLWALPTTKLSVA